MKTIKETFRICPHCHNIVFAVKDGGKNQYKYECLTCDENFYDFECQKIELDVPKKSTYWRKMVVAYGELEKLGLVDYDDHYYFQNFEQMIEVLTPREKREIIEMCDFETYKVGHRWALYDRQHGNLGNIESERFNSLNAVLDRMNYTYFYSNGYNLLA